MQKEDWSVVGEENKKKYAAAKDEVRTILWPSLDDSSRPGIYWNVPDPNVSIKIN